MFGAVCCASARIQMEAIGRFKQLLAQLVVVARDWSLQAKVNSLWSACATDSRALLPLLPLPVNCKLIKRPNIVEG